MLLSLSHISSEQFGLQYDAVVVGSGPSGLTFARAMHEARRRVLVLEAGPAKPKRPGPDEGVLPMQDIGLPRRLSPTYANQVGGGSSLWHGVMGPLDDEDFEVRPWIPHSGWPISQADLSSHIESLANRYQYTGEYFHIERLPDDLRALLAALEFDHNVLQNKLLIQATKPARFANDSEYIKRSEFVDLVSDSPVLELLGASTSAAVSGLRIGKRGGGTVDLNLRENCAIVLCGGAQQNPRLLLNSRSRHHAGLGNGEGLVGRFLGDHPMGNAFQLRLAATQKSGIYSEHLFKPGQKIRSGLRLKARIAAETGMPNHAVFLRPAFAAGLDDKTERVKLSLLTLAARRAKLGDFLTLATNLNLARQVLAYKLAMPVRYDILDAFLVCEQTPNPESKVTLAEDTDAFGYRMPTVDWQVNSFDIESVERFYSVVAGAIDPSFASPIWTPRDAPWAARFSSAAHHLGTCRMANSPKFGVVNENLRLFEASNVYVADGSVFPTTGNTNPTLVASALAQRLAKYLTE